MYLVLMLSNNRVDHIKAFDVWDLATMYADELVMDLKGVTNDLPDWEDVNVFEWCGVAVVIESTDVPIRNRGAMCVARAHADADRIRKAK